MAIDYYSNALARLVAVTTAIAPDLDCTPGSVLYDIFRAVASSDGEVHNAVDASQGQAYSSTAFGQALRNLAVDAGVTFTIPSFASGQVTITAGPGAPGGQVSIPSSSRVWTTPGSASDVPLFFLLQGDVVIPSPGSASVLVRCQTVGQVGNVAAHALTTMDTVDYVTGVDNPSAFTNGSDPQSDASIRAATSAARTLIYTKAAVEAAALAVPGCAFATLIDPQDGSGTGQLHVAAQDGTLSAGLTSAVQAAVAPVLPLTESVVVSAFDLAYAAIAGTIAVTGDQSVALPAVVALLDAYVNSLAAGQTLQPYPLDLYIKANLAQGGFTLNDFNLTSAIPVVSAGNPTTPPQLLRFLAPPALAFTMTQTENGSMSNETVAVALTYQTDTGQETALGPQQSMVLQGLFNNSILVTIPNTPFPQHVVAVNVYSGLGVAAAYKGQIVAPGGSYTVKDPLFTRFPPSTNVSAPNITVASV